MRNSGKTFSTMALLGLALVTGLSGCLCCDSPQTVPYVDIPQYMGKWYEISKYPVFFERGLVGVTAEYTLQDDGSVRVVNKGFKGSFDGEESVAEGRATVADATTNAKLTVQFGPFPLGIFGSNYWIIDLGQQYEYAVVSDKCRRTLWILSRTPRMNAQVYDAIVARLDAAGFNTSKLELMPQPE